MFIILMLSILIMVSSSDWLLVWVGLEINTMIFIFMISNYKIMEFEFKYFLIQFSGSVLFLMASISQMNSILFFSLMIKLLMIPFIYWILPCMKLLEKKLLMIFLSLQKIGPLLFLWSMMGYSMSMLEIMFLTLNFFISILAGIVKKHWVDFLVFSSINQVILLILLAGISKSTFLFYFLIYIFTVFILILYIWNLGLKFDSQSAFYFMILSGFPPTPIFFMKMELISKLLFNWLNLNFMFFMTMIIFLSSVVYMYLNMVLSNLFHTKFCKLTVKISSLSLLPLFIIMFSFILLG